MAGVGELPPSMSQSMTGDLMTSPGDLTTSPGPAPANIMSQSMMVPSSASAADNDLMTSSTSSLNMRSNGKKYIPNRSEYRVSSLCRSLIILLNHNYNALLWFLKRALALINVVSTN